jgi:hypothetical protein
VTDDELDVIGARANAATPGPWTWPDWDDCSEQEADANNEFIAHAREDVPALVAEVRRLRA